MQGTRQFMRLNQFVPRQERAHGLDQCRFLDRKLRLSLLLQIILAVLGVGHGRAQNEILDLNFAARLFILALDNGASCTTLVGVLKLSSEVIFRIAEIKLRTNLCCAQRRHHALIVGDAIPVEYGDNHRAGRGLFADLAEMGECGLQARDADGKSGRRDRLAPEAGHEPAVTPTAADRAETYRPAFLVLDLEGQYNLVDGAGVVVETANNRFVDANPIVVSGRAYELGNLRKFFFTWSSCAAGFARRSCDCRDDACDLRVRKLRAFCKVAAFVLASLAKQHFDAFDPEPIELVDGAHRRESFFRRNVNAIHRAIENLAVVHFHGVAAAWNPERFHRISGEHAHLGVGCHRRGADSIRIELHELPETARSRLFVAEHPAETVRAVWQCQILEILGHVARQRGREVIPQREPLLVVVLKRKHAFVGSVLIGQELAEGVGIFDGRRLQRLKAVSLEHNANCFHHLTGSSDLRGPAIGEAARQARFELLGLAGLIGHLRSTYQTPVLQQLWKLPPAGLSVPSTSLCCEGAAQDPGATVQRVAVMATAQAQAKIAIPNDLEPYWMPFTANRAFKKRPKMIVGAKDMHYIASDGRRLLDGAAGLWCTNAGHNRE